MFTIGFIEPWTWLVMVICGLIGFVFSGERVLAVLPFFGNTKDRNSKILGYLAVIAGLIATVWLTLLIADENAQFRWLTVLVFVAFMVVAFAHPVKDLEGWEMILLAIPFLLIAIVAFWFKSDRTFRLFGGTIPLWVVLGVVFLIMLLIVLIVFFVEESFVDPILYLLGWAPVVFVVSLITIIQGIFLLVYPIDGLLKLLGI